MNDLSLNQAEFVVDIINTPHVIIQHRLQELELQDNLYYMSFI